MVKLKDDVELDVLKKYGFSFNEIENEYQDCYAWYDKRIVDCETRELFHLTEEVGYWAIQEDDDLLEAVFNDLAKDNLIERIED